LSFTSNTLPAVGVVGTGETAVANRVVLVLGTTACNNALGKLAITDKVRGIDVMPIPCPYGLIRAAIANIDEVLNWIGEK
jgi:hypothetical protein